MVTTFLFSMMFSPAMATDPNHWTGSVCAALISGVRSDELRATNYEAEIAEFRRSLKPFTPDIRESSYEAEWVAADKAKTRFSFIIQGEQPALRTIRYHATTPPDVKDTVHMAQRAYGIEYDIDAKAEGTFHYGFAIRGREKILKHLERVEQLTKQNNEHIEAYLAENLRPWRGGNLIAAATVGFAGYKVSTGPFFVEPLLAPLPLRSLTTPGRP